MLLSNNEVLQNLKKDIDSKKHIEPKKQYVKNKLRKKGLSVREITREEKPIICNEAVEYLTRKVKQYIYNKKHPELKMSDTIRSTNDKNVYLTYHV